MKCVLDHLDVVKEATGSGKQSRGGIKLAKLEEELTQETLGESGEGWAFVMTLW